MSSNPCRHPIEAWLHKKADGRLSPEEAVALEQQVGSCRSCQERVALFEWAGKTLHGQRAIPAGFTNNVLRRVAALRSPHRFRERPPTFLRWLPAAISALALGLVASTVYVFRHHTPLEPPHVQVELKLAGEKARTVAVAGDFNGWDAVTMKKGEDGVWRTRLSLPPGRYRYAFVVDRDKWVADPHSATVVESGYGGTDSVLDLSL
jgi:anti-sigma factor RsiW